MIMMMITVTRQCEYCYCYVSVLVSALHRRRGHVVDDAHGSGQDAPSEGVALQVLVTNS